MADDMGTQLNQFADNLKLLKRELIGKIIVKAMREAMDPVQRVAGAQYLQRTGEHDFNQTEAQLLNRWGGSKSNRHPVGESRQRRWGRGKPDADARLQLLQAEGRADFPGQAHRPCALHHLSQEWPATLDRAASWAGDVDRRAVPPELPGVAARRRRRRP